MLRALSAACPPPSSCRRSPTPTLVLYYRMSSSPFTVLLVSLMLLGGCGTPKPTPPAENDSRSLASAGARIIDVRSPEEYDAGHLVGAINIPHDQIGQKITQLTTNKSEPLLLEGPERCRVTHAERRGASQHRSGTRTPLRRPGPHRLRREAASAGSTNTRRRTHHCVRGRVVRTCGIRLR